MNWFKKIFHTCGYYRWEAGYGLTHLGVGTYEYKVCRECKKNTGEIYNFVRDNEHYSSFKKKNN